MAFTRVTTPYSNQGYFMYYATSGANMAEDLTPTFDYVIDRVRLELSIVHASVVDFVIRMSAAQDSLYNWSGIISAAMNGILHYDFHPSAPLRFQANDALDFSMDMVAANNFGLIVYGWAITGP